jgi:penicillin-binding protein 1C
MGVRKILIWAFVGLLVVFIGSIFIPFPKRLLEPAPVISLQILDRKGRLLREVLSDEEGRSRWVTLNDVSPNLIKATLAIEDFRFYRHPGIDLLSIGRALLQNIRHRRVVSGGSTITQQVIRNIFHHPRTLPYKILEAWYALRLEQTLTKDEILTQYLNRIPYGNQTFGIEAASHLYFNKPSSHLSVGESAFLAGLPKAPSLYNPYRYLGRAKRRQSEVLRQMYRKGLITHHEYRVALTQPLNLTPKEIAFAAPHFCDWILKKYTSKERRSLSTIRTTLDLEIQQEVEKILATHIKRLSKKGVSNGAVIVMENKSGDILAMVGSADYFSSRYDGQVNGALALRQPGSTLKPFTYGLALERGFTPASIIPDIPTHIGKSGEDFRPQNYDKRFHGPVRLRVALASSYNVPAVRVLKEIGVESLLRTLKEIGFENLKEDADYYGLGLTLGSGDVTLLELTKAYRLLATGRIFQRETTYLLTHILSDEDARMPAFGRNSPLNLPFPCAVKTGTSKDFRDNWTVGFTPRYTVGVWVGNFDGSPMRSVSGITGAAPVFHDVMVYLERGKTPLSFKIPNNLKRHYICPSSGKRPGPYCPTKMNEFFIEGTEPKEICSFHRILKIDKRSGMLAQKGTPLEFIEERVFEVLPPLYQSWAAREGLLMFHPPSSRPKKSSSKITITFPGDGDVFKIDPLLRKEYQALRLEAVVPEGVSEITWLINGKPIARVHHPFIAWWPLEPGRHRIEAISKDACLLSTPVEICVLR